MARLPRILHLGTGRRSQRTAGLGLVLAAALVGAAAATAPPVSARTVSPGGGASGSALPSLAYLKAHAKNDYAGSYLTHHLATSPPAHAAIPRLPAASSEVLGLDVSAYQGNVNWSAVAAAGAQFAYVKATEGTYYTNAYFAQQYIGSYDAGLIRGAYAFAIPSWSSGASQADYLVNNGGAWSADGKTLPGALDIEYNPYGAECYGLSQPAMVSWIASFLNEYHARTGRWAPIYSTTDWWSTCTGNYSGFAANSPLWIAIYSSSAGTLPAGWPYYTFWQYADAGTFPGDQDVFNGTTSRLVALAKNT
jgi:GH25 family lysozyme M1 (1,4-beta-N-acetylmuramidase)